MPGGSLYLIEIPHQTTTMLVVNGVIRSCILSKFHIKPQLQPPKVIKVSVVSYRNSTSNHNLLASRATEPEVVSYRNSTSNHNFTSILLSPFALYLIEIPHQTTTTAGEAAHFSSCILSKFHIKPQPACQSSVGSLVVSYRNSTSNHNVLTKGMSAPAVVSYRNSTSNHNRVRCRVCWR